MGAQAEGELIEASWCNRLAARLQGSLGSDAPLLTPALHGGVLAVAREVAHGTERRNAPVAAFIAGRYVEARVVAGVDPTTAFSEVLDAVAALLPPATR